MKASILEKLKTRSPLKSMGRIQGASGNGGKDRSLAFSLNLTTLIDAFCILVIFLLSNMNGQIQNLKISEHITLPAATQTSVLTEGLVVRIEKNEIFLEDKNIKKEEVAQALLTAKTDKLNSIIIQADRKADYENIGLILRAGGQAGYEKYVFAVLPGT